MIYRFFTIISCLSLLLASAMAVEPSVARIVFLTESNFKLIMKAEKVTVCRLTPREKAGFVIPERRTYDEGAHTEVAAEVLAELRSILADPQTYHLIKEKPTSFTGCVPLYGLRIRFANDKTNVDVDLCLKCGDLAVTRKGKILRETPLKDKSKLIEISGRLFGE
jgi:hypothetical protein